MLPVLQNASYNR